MDRSRFGDKSMDLTQRSTIMNNDDLQALEEMDPNIGMSHDHGN